MALLPDTHYCDACQSLYSVSLERCPGCGEYNPLVRSTINPADAIAGVMPAIRKHMLAHFKRGEAGLDDATQEVVLHLLTYSLPRFDPARGAKVSTFLIEAIINKSRDVIRRHVCHARRRPRSLPDHDHPIAPDDRLDSTIEQIADDIMKHPDRYMRPSAARGFAARMAHPDLEVRSIARNIGVQPHSLSRMMAHAREDVARIDIDEWARQ